jgi:hypothetical protein
MTHLVIVYKFEWQGPNLNGCNTFLDVQLLIFDIVLVYGDKRFMGSDNLQPCNLVI